jgi:DNA-binding MarR family transcriptional regulator
VTPTIVTSGAANPDPLAVWSTLVAVYQAVLHDVVRALGDQAGMDSGVFSALAYLERADTPHRMPMSELQSLLHPRYSQPGFSRLVQRMEADGLVERRVDSTDRRAAVLSTTRLGRRAYARANAVYSAAVKEQFGRHLTAGEGAGITRALQRVAERRGALTT